MKNHSQILCLIILLILISCNDDFNNNVVVAGKYDSSYIFHEFLPPMIALLPRDCIALFYKSYYLILSILC